MNFHQAANIFPMMIGGEFQELVKSIEDNGYDQQFPIITYQGEILDGRNRYAACLKLGIEPAFQEWDGSGTPVEYVVRANLHRRHLTSSQRAVCSLEAEKLLAEEARKRQAHGLTAPGRTLLEIFPKALEESIHATDKAAEMFNTNPHYVTDAKEIQEKDPDLLEKIRAGNMSIPQAKRIIRRKEQIEQVKSVQPPEGKYQIIYADPPWQYKFGFDIHGAALRHYNTMSVTELCELPIKELADDNAVMFLWTTSPKLEDSFMIINAWGFEYKTSFVWDKVKHVMGHYNSVRHELLLVCVRGSFPKQSDTLTDSVVTIERSDEHSEKPERFREIIDSMYPYGKRIELFARKKADGWDTWGIEL